MAEPHRRTSAHCSHQVVEGAPRCQRLLRQQGGSGQASNTNCPCCTTATAAAILLPASAQASRGAANSLWSTQLGQQDSQGGQVKPGCQAEGVVRTVGLRAYRQQPAQKAAVAPARCQQQQGTLPSMHRQPIRHLRLPWVREVYRCAQRYHRPSGPHMPA